MLLCFALVKAYQTPPCGSPYRICSLGDGKQLLLLLPLFVLPMPCQSYGVLPCQHHSVLAKQTRRRPKTAQSSSAPQVMFNDAHCCYSCSALCTVHTESVPDEMMGDRRYCCSFSGLCLVCFANLIVVFLCQSRPGAA